MYAHDLLNAFAVILVPKREGLPVLFISSFKLFFVASEESYLRQLEIEEMYGVKKDDDKKDKEKYETRS